MDYNFTCSWNVDVCDKREGSQVEGDELKFELKLNDEFKEGLDRKLKQMEEYSSVLPVEEPDTICVHEANPHFKGLLEFHQRRVGQNIANFHVGDTVVSYMYDLTLNQGTIGIFVIEGFRIENGMPVCRCRSLKPESQGELCANVDIINLFKNIDELKEAVLKNIDTEYEYHMDRIQAAS